MLQHQHGREAEHGTHPTSRVQHKAVPQCEVQQHGPEGHDYLGRARPHCNNSGPQYDPSAAIWCVTRSCSLPPLPTHVALGEAVAALFGAVVVGLQFSTVWTIVYSLLVFVVRGLVLYITRQGRLAHGDPDLPFFQDFCVVTLGLLTVICLTVLNMGVWAGSSLF